MSDRLTQYKKGLWAEFLIGVFYRVRGYRILKKRYKTHFGEIDLIAKKKKTLVFIEVKTRKDMEEALHSITPRMRRRIENAAKYYLSKHVSQNIETMRFDLAVVVPPFFIRTLDNAWIATS